MRSWKRSFRLVLTKGGLLACLCAIQIGFHAPSAAADDDLSFLTTILRNPAISDATRTDAAVRLLRLGGSGANEALSEALRSGETAQVEAVARALADNGVPPRLVADALVAALLDASPDFGVLAGRTLARLGESEITPILAMSLDPDASDATRIAAIRALGGFQYRASVEALINMLDATGDPTRLAAITSSLYEITRIDLGEEKARWRSWWDAVDSMPLEQAIGAASAGNQAQQLEAQRESIELLQARQTRLSDRLQSVLGDWFLTLPETERGDRLHVMLGDELSVVHLFAANQVQRLLRNGVVPDEQTVAAVLVLLDDEVAELRILGAQLLAAIGIEGLPERLARKVTEEIDPQVASVMLDQIALRPCPDAFEPVLARLDDGMTGAAAARALSRMVDSKMVPEGWVKRARPLVRELHARLVIPATASLFVLVGEDADLEVALLDLDHDSLAVRRASAFSFVARQRYEPVVARSDDEGVRPAAIKAFGLMPPSTDNLLRMLAIEPEETQLVLWRESLRMLAVRFPESQVLNNDDLLSQSDRVSIQMRVDLLDAAMSSNAFESDAVFKGRLLERFTGLLVEGSRWQEVAKVLGRPGIELAGILPKRLFTARMRIEDFEGAANIEDSPNAWLDYLDTSIEIAPAGAATIVEEIRTRFDGRLDEDQLERLDGIILKIAIVDGSMTEPEVD